MSFLIKLIGSIDLSFLRQILLSKRYLVTDKEQIELFRLCKKSNYIILTKHRWTVSSWMVLIASRFLMLKRCYWTHALMNVEGDTGTVRLFEAIGEGVKISNFHDVFNCDSFCVLRPRMPPGISREQLSWEKLNDAAYSHLGKEYDSLADILDDRKLNCVEYVWDCLKNIPGSDIWFSGLKKMIEKNGNLCPEMFYDCGSFEIVYEVRH